MVAWAYGPVTSYSLSLHEIDTVQNRRPFVPSAVETIVRKVGAGASARPHHPTACVLIGRGLAYGTDKTALDDSQMTGGGGPIELGDGLWS